MLIPIYNKRTREVIGYIPYERIKNQDRYFAHKFIVPIRDMIERFGKEYYLVTNMEFRFKRSSNGRIIGLIAHGKRDASVLFGWFGAAEKWQDVGKVTRHERFTRQHRQTARPRRTDR